MPRAVKSGLDLIEAMRPASHEQYLQSWRVERCTAKAYRSCQVEP